LTFLFLLTFQGSDSAESAQAEISLWFKPEEAVEFTKNVDAWVYEK
jgi:hypothetical protein